MPPARAHAMLSYPSSLRAPVAHAARFGDALEALLGRTVWGDRSFVWLIGRAGEVRAFVGDVVRDWSRGRLDTEDAELLIERYLLDLHASLRDVLGYTHAPCCLRRGDRPTRSANQSFAAVHAGRPGDRAP